jgi:hypothetical protein
MDKHTDAPWEVVEPANGYVQIIGGIDGDADEYGRPVMSSVHICDVIDNQDEEANARLIAAAPDLLAALKGIVKFGPDAKLISTSDDTLAAAITAIAKAESSPPAHSEGKP